MRRVNEEAKVATKKSNKATKKRAKKPLIHRVATYNFFLIFAVLLGMIAGVMMVKIFYTGEPKDTTPSISLGAIQYDFSSGKAVKRSSPALASLKDFLDKSAAKDCTAVQPSMEPSQYGVIAANSDVSQVLLGYGCGDTSARMFALRDGNTWHFVSPTNHFDTLYGLPECGYVKKYNISSSIAPVCYFLKGDIVKYKVL